MYAQRCLGIVLKRINKLESDDELKINGRTCDVTAVDHQSSTASSNCVCDAAGDDWMYESGFLIYQEFQEENRQCFWNSTLIESVSNLEYMGYIAPGTLLICGNEYYLEAIRSAWARRVLRSPANFIITRLGDVSGLEIQVIPQTQFTPLPEALCLVVSELNLDKQTASLGVIFSCLRERFSDMIIPNQEVVYGSLGKLIKDRKVYHTGDGYFVVTPETYHMTTVSSAPERPLLMSNEEAIHKLHGGELMTSPKSSNTATRTRSIQTNMAADSDEDFFTSNYVSKSLSSDRHLSMSKLERCGSLRLSRKEKYKSEEMAPSEVNGGGKGRTNFIRSESMRLSPEKNRSQIRDINLKSSPAHKDKDVEKGEKLSMFSKLFRRSSSKRRKASKSPAKATFSAQFPPLEWSDPHLFHFHSRSTQTLSKESTKSLSTPNSTPNVISTPNNNNNNHNNNNNKNVSLTVATAADTEASSASPSPVANPLQPQTQTQSQQQQTQLPLKCKTTDSLTRSYKMADKQMTSLTSLTAAATPSSQHAGRTRSVNRLSGAPGESSKQKVSGSGPRTASTSRVTSTSSSSSRNKMSARPLIGGGETTTGSLHSSATSLNRMSRNVDDVEEQYKLTDMGGAKKAPRSRWSVHEAMNNSSAALAPKQNGGKFKSVNKLNSSSSARVAIRPTQAIKPLNQYVEEKAPSNVINSPSFSQSFDLESTDFKSITAQKLLKGISVNSIDTIVEVNMLATDKKTVADDVDQIKSKMADTLKQQQQQKIEQA
ncbi:hypothetical protein CHUAL_008953 [Chamberlinius hualienensis]